MSDVIGLDCILAYSLNRQKKKGIYYESHHIIPKSMGGKEEVLLTAKEHFICHLLLCKMLIRTEKHKMINALIKMASDFYVFVDTSSDVIFYISKLDMTSDTENWVSGGDGVYYKLTNSNPTLHRIDVKLPSEMKKILDSEEKSLYQTLREEERRILDLEAQRARNLYEAISTQDLS